MKNTSAIEHLACGDISRRQTEMSRKDLSGLERFHLELYSARGRATETRNASVRESSSGGKALAHRPFFLSLPYRLRSPRPAGSFLFLFLGAYAVACARANSRRIGISTRRGYLSIERYSDRDVSQLPAEHAAVILSSTRAPTRKLSFLTLRIVRGVGKHARRDS